MPRLSPSGRPRRSPRQLNLALEQRASAHLALSGGTTPGRTYELLASSPVAWERIDVWFADERCVGPEDEQSNYRLAAESLLKPGGVPTSRVHRMEGELGPERGAHSLRSRAPSAAPRRRRGAAGARRVVLGIGPGRPRRLAVSGGSTLDAPETAICLGVEDSPEPPPERITLSLQMLRVARCCVLLATGAAKADAVDAMLGEPSSHVPASLLRRERLTVIADDSASGPAPAQR